MKLYFLRMKRFNSFTEGGFFFSFFFQTDKPNLLSAEVVCLICMVKDVGEMTQHY